MDDDNVQDKHTCAMIIYIYICILDLSVLLCCCLGGRKGIHPVKTEWWDAGLVICLG